jgi:translation initiation factor IF-3
VRATLGIGRKRISRPLRVNDRIRVREVRVIDEEGNQLGVMLTRDALERARELGLDLVEVAPNATPPVCRLMDFGRYKYDQSRREREARKNQKTQDIKEVRITGILIDQHDLETKARDVKRLLKEGNKVRVSVIFRGARQMSHPEIGDQLMRKMVEMLAEDATIDSPARQEGRIISMLVSPKAPARPPREQAEPATPPA